VQGVFQFDLVYGNVTPYNHEDEFAIGDIEDGFQGAVRWYLQEARYLFDRGHTGGGYLFQRQRLTAADLAPGYLCLLYVGTVFAGGAMNNLVLTGFGNDHELVGVLTPDGTAIGLDAYCRQAAAVIDIVVGLEHLIIGDVQCLGIGVKAVKVHHVELAGAD